MKIEKDQAHLRTDRLGAHYQTYTIPPGGWLIAVTVQFDRASREFTWPDGMDRDEPLRFEITDPIGAALFGGFGVDHHMGFDQGGIVFDEPLPNVNSAHPYGLWIKDVHPALLVHTLNCRWTP